MLGFCLFPLLLLLLLWLLMLQIIQTGYFVKMQRRGLDHFAAKGRENPSDRNLPRRAQCCEEVWYFLLKVPGSGHADEKSAAFVSECMTFQIT